MSKGFEKFKQMLGLDNPEEGTGDNYHIANIDIDSSNSSFSSAFSPSNTVIADTDVDIDSAAYQTIFLDPKSFSDCKKIVDYIRANKMVTFNLEYLDEPTAIRLMNFLSGAMTVTDANYLIISKKVYTVVPASMKVYYEGKKIVTPKIFGGFKDGVKSNEK